MNDEGTLGSNMGGPKNWGGAARQRAGGQQYAYESKS